MDHNKEYHDPDYPEVAVRVKEEPPSLSEEEKVEKIRSIIRREFSNELEVRESEVMLIDQRMASSRRLLHRLRYELVTKYYSDQKLFLSNGQIQDEIASQRDPRARAEAASLLCESQRRLHPSVRKLLGKQSVDFDEIFRTRGPRNRSRKDYSAMLQKRNYTISADATKTLRPDYTEDLMQLEPCSSQPKKIPRHLEPKVTNVVTLDEATRNKMKHRYRIIIGNTSKYVPAASRLDRSTHKWLLYVRAAAAGADVARVLAAVTVTLHHSYAPHHVVHLDKPPYHISRRGWGEFPARVQLHFALPQRNRPATVEHSIKLDRNYTGMQMLGSETVVDVWLYSTQQMLQYEYKEDEDTQADTHADEPPDIIPEIKTEEPSEANDEWMDFFTKAPTELDVDEMIIKPVKKEKIEEPPEEIVEQVQEPKVPIKEECNKEVESRSENILEVPNEIFNQPTSIKKRIVKYIDPTTGKIYYLEMDRELDLSKVQEIIINNQTAKISPIKSNGLKNVRKKKGGISLLKPEVKSLLKSENNRTERLKPNLAHIENDHCYLAAPRNVLPSRILNNVASEVEIKKEKSLFSTLCSVMHRFTSVRAAVNYLVKHIPLISDEVRDPDFLKHFPFVVENSEKYWKLDFAKRRNIEWSRAKLINRILTEHFRHSETIWRTKQILLYIRLHGHYPIRNEFTSISQSSCRDWSSWHDAESSRRSECSMKEAYPCAADINTLSIFSFERDKLANDSLVISDDEEIDVLGTEVRAEGRREAPGRAEGEVLPAGGEDRLRFLFVERKCQDIGIELRNEDIGSGYSYSAVHAVLVSAMKSFAEELIRGALAAKRREDNPQATPSVWNGCPSARTSVALPALYAAARAGRLRLLAARDLAARRRTQHAL